jgi:hypothetical protein
MGLVRDGQIAEENFVELLELLRERREKLRGRKIRERRKKMRGGK